MKSRGMQIMAIDGYHEDGWCHPLVRATGRALNNASKASAVVWIKPEPGVEAVDGLFKIQEAPGIAFRIPVGQPAEIESPVDLLPGQEFSITLMCAHRVIERGEDRRDLSFALLDLGLS